MYLCETKKNKHFSTNRIWLVIIGVTILRAIVLTQTSLVPDETYYWDWSRFLSFGYFDHPPMIAWLTYLSTAVLGDTLAGIKTVPLVGGLGISIVLYFLGRRFLESESGIILLILLGNFTLVFAIGGLILTPDIPMVFFWSLALLFAYEALFKGNDRAWPVLGVAMGLGLLSKYVFVLFGLALFLVIILGKNHSKLLRSWKPWTALLIAFLVYLSNIIWNMQNDWISYRFQLGHGSHDPDIWRRLQYFSEYVGSQVGLLSPLVFITLILATIFILKHIRSDKRLLFLLVFTYVPWLFFAYISWSRRVEANWPAPAMMTAIILVVWYWEKSKENKGLRRFIHSGILFSFFTTLIITTHSLFPFLPIEPQRDRTYEARDWKSLTAQVYQLRKQVDPTLKLPLCANSYQLTSLLAYYSPDQPRTFALNVDSRLNHYALLAQRAEALQDTFLFVEELQKGRLDRKYQKVFRYYEMKKFVDRELTPSYYKWYGIYKVVLNPESYKKIVTQAGFE
jgi:4-amino-4-deoxy-L-arabinose transferase-like glycosyltransferase